jgi:hypothetical protein
MSTTIQDYGRYQVGSESFYNKLEAIAAHVRIGQAITWHIFEEELDQIDLTQEPQEDIRELYAKRARELRDHYDHLVLHFSGGTDTAAIVEIFRDNGITIDEIFVRTYGDHAAKNLLDPETPEMELLTLPLARWVKDNIWPRCELTVVDTSKHIIDYFKKNTTWYDTHNRSILDPTWQIRGDYDVLNPSWQVMANRGLKVGHIIGKEKPQLRSDDKGFYFFYSDRGIESHLPARTLEIGMPHHVEMFFWHPSTVRMQIKQAHMLMAAWNGCPVISRPDELAFTRRYEDEVAKYIYGRRTIPLPFSGLKMEDMPNGARFGVYIAQSQWFAENLKEDATKTWMKGVFKVYEDVKPLYKDRMDFFKRGLPSVHSKRHYIRHH